MKESEAKTKWPVTGRKLGHSKGYIRVLCKNHPNAGKDGYVYENIYIGSLMAGRAIKPNETVHHIDGNPANNDKENLLLCTKKEHRQLHARLEKDDNYPQFTSKKTNNRPTCNYIGCDKQISYNSKTGLCLKHYWENFRNTKPVCSIINCISDAGHRSGLCRKHLQKLHNDKRYS